YTEYTHTPALSLHRPYFFTHPSTSETSTLSLHDALPIFHDAAWYDQHDVDLRLGVRVESIDPSAHTLQADGDEVTWTPSRRSTRSEEYTSELQSLTNLVCRLLLEKKNKKPTRSMDSINSN